MLLTLTTLFACAGPRPTVVLPQWVPNDPAWNAVRLVEQEAAADALQAAVDLEEVRAELDVLDADIVGWGLVVGWFSEPGHYHYTVRLRHDGRTTRVQCRGEADPAWYDAGAAGARETLLRMAPACAERLLDKVERR